MAANPYPPPVATAALRLSKAIGARDVIGLIEGTADLMRAVPTEQYCEWLDSLPFDFWPMMDRALLHLLREVHRA
jgi:hypothetical protein